MARLRILSRWASFWHPTKGASSTARTSTATPGTGCEAGAASVNSSKPPALVVGTGFGCRTHVPALRAAGFEVAGLVGADAERTRRRAESSDVPQAFTEL